MRRFLAAAACGLTLAAGAARAYDSDLDPSFSDGTLRGYSKPYFDVGGYPSEFLTRIFRDDAGRYLLLGKVCTSAACTTFDIGIVRLLSNGRFDTGYGNGGYVRFAQSFLGDIADAARDAQGRYLVVGPTAAGATSDTDFGVIRLQPDGQLDTGFAVTPPPLGSGQGGRANIDFGLGGSGDDVPTSVAVLADGSIVVAGFVTNVDHYDAGLAKLTPSGQRDNLFGTAGRAHFGFGSDTSPPHSLASSIAVEATGTLLVAGAVQPVAGGNSQFALARYRADGSGFDASFCAGASCNGGNPGRKIIAATNDPTRPYYDIAPHVVTDADGFIYLGGTVNGYMIGQSGASTDVFLMGFDVFGHDLPGFAARAFQDVSNGTLLDLAVDPRPMPTPHGPLRRLVYAGKALDGAGGSFALVGRFLVGDPPFPDFTFAPPENYSYVTLTTPHRSTETKREGWFSTILFDGPRIVLGGATFYCCSDISYSNYDFVAARLVDDTIFANDFEPPA